MCMLLIHVWGSIPLCLQLSLASHCVVETGRKVTPAPFITYIVGMDKSNLLINS